MPLQRIQERKKCLLLSRAQFPEALPLVFGFAAVTFDGAFQRQGSEIMHVPGVHAESPQRHGAQLISRVLRRILDDAVAGFDVVQQEVAVGMNDLMPQSLRNSERSAVDDRPRWGRNNGADMASGAANPLEQVL